MYSSIIRLSALVTILLIASGPLTLQASLKNGPPNIVVILTDDYGYDDVGINNKQMVTPNIDRLARQSTSFEQYYVHVSCAPTRASFLTGRHFLRTGVWGVHGGRDFIRPRESLLPEVLQANGYKTGMAGKWHSGKTHGYYPWDRGFDFAHMARLYKYNPEMGARSLTPEGVIPIDGWAEAFYTDRALEFIDANRDNPFFLYVPYMSTHSFWRAPQKYIDKHLARGSSESLAVFQGMTEYLDHQVGRILDKLEETGLDENTIVIFFSDNGPIGSGGAKPDGQKGSYFTRGKDWAKRNPHGMRGGKGQVFENGVRSVLYIKRPGDHSRIEINEVTSVHDLYPTILDLAGVSQPENQLPLDGQSLRPLLNNPDTPAPFWAERSHVYCSPTPNGTLGRWGANKSGIVEHPIVNKVDNADLFRFENMNFGLRKGDFKYIQFRDEISIYNVKKDPKEKTPITDRPEILEALQSEARAFWNDIVSDPHTFWKPKYNIGSESYETQNSIVYLTGAHDFEGNVKMEAHGSYDWKHEGDALIQHIKIAEPARYRVSLSYQTSATPSNALFEITIDGHKLRKKITTPQTDKIEEGHFGISPQHISELGVIELEKTEETELRIELIKNPLSKEAVKRMHFLYFEKV